MNNTTAEISFDLVMEENMPQIEGCYRLEGSEWKVFIFLHTSENLYELGVKQNVIWKSGATGVTVTAPDDVNLNKDFVERTLSELFSVDEWIERVGPDSMMLR